MDVLWEVVGSMSKVNANLVCKVEQPLVVFYIFNWLGWVTLHYPRAKTLPAD